MHHLWGHLLAFAFVAAHGNSATSIVTFLDAENAQALPHCCAPGIPCWQQNVCRVEGQGLPTQARWELLHTSSSAPLHCSELVCRVLTCPLSPVVLPSRGCWGAASVSCCWAPCTRPATKHQQVVPQGRAAAWTGSWCCCWSSSACCCGGLSKQGALRRSSAGWAHTWLH